MWNANDTLGMKIRNASHSAKYVSLLLTNNELFNGLFGKGCYQNKKLLSENVDKFEHNDEWNTECELLQS